VIAVCGVIGWSRVALGHHYVSDILIGTVIGATIATSVGAFLY
jgi:membrane-associated phospholipid phosphatase